MKTVQEYLCDLDEDRLIETYLYIHPIQFEELNNVDLSVAEIIEKYKTKLHKYIDRLRTLPIKRTDTAGIFYVHRIIKDGMNDQDYCMIDLNELLEKGYDAPDYSYIFTEQSEIMGWQVADTWLTQYYIYELIADVMFEASFFGYEQEHLEEEKNSLKKAMELPEQGKEVLWEDIRKEMFGENYVFDDESEDEEELRQAVIIAESEYSNHSRKKELDALLTLIRNNK